MTNTRSKGSLTKLARAQINKNLIVTRHNKFISSMYYATMSHR